MADFDPFYLFRTTLLIAVWTFTLVTFAETVVAISRILRGAEAHRKLLRTYLAYQLLSIRLAPLRGELALLALWSAALMLVWCIDALL